MGYAPANSRLDLDADRGKGVLVGLAIVVLVLPGGGYHNKQPGAGRRSGNGSGLRFPAMTWW